MSEATFGAGTVQLPADREDRLAMLAVLIDELSESVNTMREAFTDLNEEATDKTR